MRPTLLLPAALATALPFATHAQETAPPTTAPSAPASLDACVALEQDAQRLACFDTMTGRATRTPAQADTEAAVARELRNNPAVRADAMAEAPVAHGLYAHDGSSRLEAAIANAGQGSLLDSRWELARDSKLGLFNLRAYKPVYLLPAFWTSDKNETPSSPNPENTVTTPQTLDSLEAKFQLSFKTKAVENLFDTNGDIWMGYTQSSRWQVYNTEDSRPFRETNYEPEVLMVFRNNYSIGGWNGRMAAIGVNHQSNGRGDPLSRSWNRVMFNVGLDRENWAVMIRPWVRISDGNEDDNPDIEDYMGRGDLTLTHVRGGHEFSLMARHSLRGGDRSHGALQFDWGFPIHKNFRGHLQIFDGYGESLIDYNHKATYVGLGISLLEWF
ncbi:phospholipase A [Luteimonas terrae]|uniref:Phospholipase A1 n=1 Tax=Luteimonas terrae TaxID=1530191 RepID=A0A4R5UCY6_9GAMM|nr:phospholipase A [Luteimonas terrae]TDK32971.1 phospholipase [Luteimonas terrae]